MKIHRFGPLDLREKVRFRLGAGVGKAHEYILAFDRALRKAGFADYNLLKVSSVLPPGSSPADKVDLPKGYLLPIAYGEKVSNVPGERVGAAVAVAIPKDTSKIGIIMEVTGPEPAYVLIARAEDLARQALLDRGIEVDRILSSGVDAKVEEGFVCAFAGVALWRSPS
ncbi:MAG: pyruvoyl-dependent arginine decarboxylase [Thermotogae bacterium]|nr:pyruvoyl-dependent arginine decarboxylase [Thermotogota bacterium]